VQDRLASALKKKAELEANIERETNGFYGQQHSAKFSAAQKASLRGIDWRVPRLQYCQDPLYNRQMDPMIAFQVQERKAADSQVLEYELSREANAQWAAALSPLGMAPPPLEKVVKHSSKASFVEATPNYAREDDVWNRRLDLRTLQEATRGDVSKPMARPVLFPEDYANYQEGRYVRDDCPIA